MTTARTAICTCRAGVAWEAAGAAVRIAGVTSRAAAAIGQAAGRPVVLTTEHRIATVRRARLAVIATDRIVIADPARAVVGRADTGIVTVDRRVLAAGDRITGVRRAEIAVVTSDGIVVANASLHENFLTHQTVSLNPVEVILTNGINKSRDTVLPGRTLLNGCFNVASDKGGALIVEVGRVLRRYSDICDP